MNFVEVAVPFFILAMGLEYLYGLVRGKQTYRLNDTVNSLSMGVLSRLVDVLKLSFSAAVFAAVVSWFGVDPWSMEAAWQWVIAFVAYDACYYWKHRFGHESRLFWASHVAHHQSEEFNLSTALRQTGTDYLGFVFYLPLFIIGVPPLVVVTVGSLNLIYQFWVHTEHVRRLGPLEWIFVTPSNHRVHHARNPQYLDKNYGGVFIIWDRLFGTFQDELAQEPCVYGTVKPLASWNPLWANVHVWFETLRLSIKTQYWKDKILVWFKGPGWFPDDMTVSYDCDISTEKFNPPASISIKIYAFINFWLITAASLWLLDGFNAMPQWFVLLLFVWMSFSLYVFGVSIEGHSYWKHVELSRVCFTFLLAACIYLLWPDYTASWVMALLVYGSFNLLHYAFIQLSLGKPPQSVAAS